MLTFESPEFQSLIGESAALRGRGQFSEAIALIESRLDDMEDDCLANAYLEIFYAAAEAGLLDKARMYARMLNAREPGLPSVQAYLA